MNLDEQKDRLKQRLLAAPKRERTVTYAALLRSMRDEIVQVFKEKIFPTRTFKKCSPPTA